MSSQSTELDLDLSNLSCQEEDPITRNLESFKLLLLHRFPGCTIVDHRNNSQFTNFEVIFNILDTSKFEIYTEEAEQRIRDNGHQHEPVKILIHPLSRDHDKTITYCFGILGN